MSKQSERDAQVAAQVAADMTDAIRDLIFDAWDFPAQRLRVAFEGESSDRGNNDPDGPIEVVDENRDLWRLQITVTATAVGDIDDATAGPDEEASA
jgi:hypothetical protein